MKPIKILAIESSCDETAAAVIGGEASQPVILSNVISSQVDLHAATGGVVPEVASRAHMEGIGPVVALALLGESISNNNIPTIDADAYQKAITKLDDVTHIAVTAGPGLIGSLLVGFNAAKTLAYSRNLPIIPVNHIEGHIYSALAGSNVESSGFSVESRGDKTLDPKPSTQNLIKFPILSLTVSGGHTSLTLMKDHGVYEPIGATIDDAVGEAYDKVAKLLGLGYPGGPALSKLAEQFRKKSNNNRTIEQSNHSSIVFPRPILNDGTFNFSLSGLKTAVLVRTKKIMAEQNLSSPEEIDDVTKAEIAAAFEEAVADVLTTKTIRAVEKFEPKAIVFAGGVSANSYLRDSLKFKVEGLKQNITFLTPMQGLYGDNAAMIGLAAYYHIKRGDIKQWDEIQVDANLKLV